MSAQPVPITSEEIEQLRLGAIDLYSNDDLFSRLYEYYLSTGEMPYGTAKARTGDPYEWILHRLEDTFL